MDQKSKSSKTAPTANVGVKIAVLGLIVVSIVALVTSFIFIGKLKEKNRDLQQQALELEKENKALQEYISKKDTDEGVQDVAKDELGMVDPDTIIYDFEETTAE